MGSCQDSPQTTAPPSSMSPSSKLVSLFKQSLPLARTPLRPALASRPYSSQPEGDLEVNIPMIRKMEKIWRNYIDQLEQPGGKQFNIQNFMMMYIFGSITNTAYRTKLFDHCLHTWRISTSA